MEDTVGDTLGAFGESAFTFFPWGSPREGAAEMRTDESTPASTGTAAEAALTTQAMRAAGIGQRAVRQRRRSLSREQSPASARKDAPPPQRELVRAAPSEVDAAMSKAVARETRMALAVTGGATLALRGCLGIVALFFALITTLPAADYVLLAIPALLVVPFGVLVGFSACAGSLLWTRRWALLYSGTLGCASVDSALCVLAVMVSALYVAYAVSVATGGSTLDDVLASAGAERAAEANATAIAFRVAAIILMISALGCILVDFFVAYFTAAARYLVDYEVSKSSPEEKTAAAEDADKE